MVPVRYESLTLRFPQTVEQFLNELRNSNSEYKNVSTEKIIWAYRFGFFGKKKKDEAGVKEMLYNERLNYELGKIRVDVIMTAKSYLRGDRVINNPENLPEEVYNFVKEFVKVKMMFEQEENGSEVVKNSIPPIEGNTFNIPLNGVDPAEESVGKVKPKHTDLEDELDDLLKKISDTGFESLSREEKTRLKDLSNSKLLG